MYFGHVLAITEISERVLQHGLLDFRYRLGNAPSPPGSSDEEEREEDTEEAPNRSSIQDQPKNTPKKQHDGSLYTLIIIMSSNCLILNLRGGGCWSRNCFAHFSTQFRRKTSYIHICETE